MASPKLGTVGVAWGRFLHLILRKKAYWKLLTFESIFDYFWGLLEAKLVQKSSLNDFKERLGSVLGKHVEKSSQNNEKIPSRRWEIKLFWWTVVQNHTFADRQQCRKKHPQRPHFGEVFGTKIVLRSTKFILETDSKINRFSTYLLIDFCWIWEPRWRQDGTKMVPRWRQDDAQMPLKI